MKMKMIITAKIAHVFDDLCRNLEEVPSCSPGLRGTSYPGFLPAQGAKPERLESGPDLAPSFNPLGGWRVSWMQNPG
jgi:hypothetical protein